MVGNMILKGHKNQWLNIVRESGTDISNFISTEIGELGFKIELRATPLEFYVEQDPQDFDKFRVNITEFKPDFPHRELWLKPSSLGSIPYYADPESVSNALKTWLVVAVERYLVEKETPDLWAQFRSFSASMITTSISGDGIEQFTPEEKKQIKEGIQEFRRLIVAEFNPMREELKIIDHRLDYLGKAVESSNRFDWKALAIYTSVTIAIALTLDTETGKHLFNLFMQAIGHITGLLPPTL